MGNISFFCHSRGEGFAARQAVSNCALAWSSVAASPFMCTLGGLPTTPYNDQNQRVLSVIAHGQLLAYCPPQTTLKAPGKPTKPPVCTLRQPGRA